ncbi:hypothetical protein ACVWY3_004815 [Bradyrhizobium sp. USDA 4486]
MLLVKNVVQGWQLLRLTIINREWLFSSIPPPVRMLCSTLNGGMCQYSFQVANANTSPE